MVFNTFAEKMKLRFLLVLIGLNLSSLYAQQDTSKKNAGTFYADIHTSFYHDFNNHTSPQTAFQLSTAIMGYKRQLSDKINALIIYDVTRTTNFTFPDTIGIGNYFEGSKYTAFLKAAEITYKPAKKISLSIGQLLSDQYLTLSDKHWGHRYIAFTMQEQFRFGNPADFGMRAAYQFHKNLTFTAIIVNGEGPFKYQDQNSEFLYAGMLDLKAGDSWIARLYSDFRKDPSGNENHRYTQSALIGFKNKVLTAAVEASNVINNNFTTFQRLQGVSLYGIYALKDTWNLLARADYFNKFSNVENELFWLVGMEYKPITSLGISANFRRNTWLNQNMLVLSCGLRF